MFDCANDAGEQMQWRGVVFVALVHRQEWPQQKREALAMPHERDHPQPVTGVPPTIHAAFPGSACGRESNCCYCLPQAA
jgi:hypothetical protein